MEGREYDPNKRPEGMTNKDIRENIHLKAKNHFQWLWWLGEMIYDEMELYPAVYSAEDIKELERQIEWHEEKSDWFERTAKMYKVADTQLAQREKEVIDRDRVSTSK